MNPRKEHREIVFRQTGQPDQIVPLITPHEKGRDLLRSRPSIMPDNYQVLVRMSEIVRPWLLFRMS